MAPLNGKIRWNTDTREFERSTDGGTSFSPLRYDWIRFSDSLTANRAAISYATVGANAGKLLLYGVDAAGSVIEGFRVDENGYSKSINRLGVGVDPTSKLHVGSNLHSAGDGIHLDGILKFGWGTSVPTPSAGQLGMWYDSADGFLKTVDSNGRYVLRVGANGVYSQGSLTLNRNGGSILQKDWQTVSLANDGVANMTLDGIGLFSGILVVNAITWGTAVFITNTVTSAVGMIAELPANKFTAAAAGTASRVNFYYSVGNARMELENKSGGALTINAWFLQC